MSDDQGLLQRLLTLTAKGDRNAFSTLYQQSADRLFGLCLRMLRDHDDAEEVLQESFSTIWHRAGSFDAALASPMTWMTTITRNKVIDRIRQKPRAALQADASALDAIEDAGPGPALSAELSEDHQRLSHCLDELEPDHQRVVREAFFRGLTYNQLAQQRQVPLGTMKSWIRRSLLQLRACLES